MKQSEAKRQILELWFKWAEANGSNIVQMRAFYDHLEKDRPDLLDFSTKDPDRWQTVRAWLNNAKR